MSLARMLVLAVLLQVTTAEFHNWAESEEATISLLQVHAEPKQGQVARKQGVNSSVGSQGKGKGKAQGQAKAASSGEQAQSSQSSQQSQTLTKTSAAAADIARGIQLLRQSLTGQYQEAEKQKQQTKASYEAQLAEQAKKGRQAHLENANLTADVAKLDQGNARLWSKAKALKSESANLGANIKSLEDNISVAQDFVTETFRRLDNATSDTVLDVLDELEKSDKETASTSSHKEKLHAIEKLSMLAIGTASRINSSTKPEEASNMLRTLNLTLDEASLAQTETSEQMKEAFQTRFTANAEKLAKLEEGHQTLLADLESKRARQGKLIAAVELLVKERDQLVTRKTQAAKFWHLISSRS